MLHRVLNRARRRALMDQALRSTGRGLSAGLAIALMLLIVDRAAALALPLVVFAGPPIAGLLAGLIVALARPPSRFDAAVQLDRRLGLKDRVGTAESIRLGLIPKIAAGEFAALAQRDAQLLAGRIDVRSAMPIRMDRAWVFTALGALLLAAGIGFLPAMNWSSAAGQADRTAAAAPAELLEARTTIARSIEQAAQTLADSPQDDQSREQLAALDRLAEQLKQPQPSEPELRQARDEAAAQLDDVADHMDRQARRDLAATDEIAQRFSGLPPADSTMTAEQFAQALRRGDFGKAADTLEKVLADPNALTDSQRHELADHLRNLREQLEHAPAPDAPAAPADDRDQQLRQALRDQGMDDPAIDDLLKNDSQARQPAGKQEQKLREQGVDEDVARRLAQELEKAREQKQIDREAQRQSQRLADALEQTARELTHPPEEPPQQSPQKPQADRTTEPAEERGGDSSNQSADHSKPEPGQTGSDQTNQPSQQPGAQPAPAVDATKPTKPQSPTQPGAQTPQPDSKPGDQPRPQPTDQTGNQPDQTSSPQPGQKPSPGAKPGEQPGTQPGQKPGVQPGAQPGVQPGVKPGEQPGAQPGQKPGAEPGQKPVQVPGAKPVVEPRPGQPAADSRPGETPATGPDGDQPDQSGAAATENSQEKPGGETSSSPAARDNGDGSPQPAPRTGSSITKMLRELAQRRQSAQRRQADSESIRKAARELAQKLTPQERQELERWARSAAAELRGPDNRGPNTPGTQSGAQTPGDQPEALAHSATHDIDVRGDEVGDQVLAQWLGRESPPGGPGTPGAPGIPGRTASAPDQIRSAQREAERAVNESSVPPRYHGYIRRFFGRLDETAHRAAPQGAGEPVAPGATPPAPQIAPADPPLTPPPAGANPS